jgi:predicted nucleic acid-binding protein
MILTDTGPLVAIFDPSEGNDHRRCVDALKTLSKPLVSTLPCVTETMYLLGKTWGWYGQFRLWHMIQNEIVDVFNLERDHLLRMSELMKKYSDTPMDFADASLGGRKSSDQQDLYFRF